MQQSNSMRDEIVAGVGKEEMLDPYCQEGSPDSRFAVSEAEWKEVSESLGRLCCYAAWEVCKSNGAAGQSHIVNDCIQDCHISLVDAAMNWKKLTFVDRAITYIIENSEHIPLLILPCVENIFCHWAHRKFMAGSNKFRGREVELNVVVRLIEAASGKPGPDYTDSLIITSAFKAYAKTIIWNTAKDRGIAMASDKKSSAYMLSLDACPWLDVDASENMNALVSGQQLKAVRDDLFRAGHSQTANVLSTLMDDPKAISDAGVVVKKTIRRTHKIAHHTVDKHLEIIRDAISRLGGIQPILDRSSMVPPTTLEAVLYGERGEFPN